MPKISLYAAHAERWRFCTGCALHERRQRVVLYRGAVPCDVLFVGEAPGESEDVLGKPFAGPAGQLLDEQIRAALAGFKTPYRIGYTNLVACIPKGNDGRKFAEPDDTHIKSCSARVVEIVGIAKPRLIVYVGKLAESWLTPGYKHSIKIPETRAAKIIHPAAILRASYDQREFLSRQAIITLRNAVEAMEEETKDITIPRPLPKPKRVVSPLSNDEGKTESYF